MQCVFVGRHEVQGVSEPGGASDVLGPAVQWHDDPEVEGDFATVVGHQSPTGTVDLAGVELGDQFDALVLQHAAELSSGDRLGERRVERCHVGELDTIANASFAEEPIGEEAELEWGNGTLDRHVDDVDDDSPAGERGQRTFQRCRSLG